MPFHKTYPSAVPGAIKWPDCLTAGASWRLDGCEPSKQLTVAGQRWQQEYFLNNTQSWCILGTLLAQVEHMYKHGVLRVLGEL